MNDTDLLILLKELSQKEVSNFSRYLKKQIETETIVFRLFQFIRKYHPDFPVEKLSYKKAQVYVFADQPIHAKAVSNAISKIKSHLEDYLIKQYLNNQKYERENILLQVYQGYQVTKLVKKQFRAMFKMLGQIKQKSHGFWLRSMFLNYAYYSDTGTDQRSPEASACINSSMNNLDYFYAGLKWKLSSEVYNGVQTSDDKKLEILLVSEIEKLKCYQNSDYHHFYRLAMRLNKEKEQAIYYQLKEDFFKNNQTIAVEDQFSILTYLLNYNASVVRKGAKDVGQENFELLKFGFEQGLFTFQGFLYSDHFLNMIGVAVDIGAVDWANRFIEQWSITIAPVTRQYYKRLGKAILYFRTQQFDQCLALLENFPNDNSQDELRERWLYIAVKYELDKNGVDHILYQINFFEKFLDKNKSIKKTTKQAVRSSLKIIKELLKVNPSKQKILEILQSDQSFHYKKWLQQKAEAL